MHTSLGHGIDLLAIDRRALTARPPVCAGRVGCQGEDLALTRISAFRDEQAPLTLAVSHACVCVDSLPTQSRSGMRVRLSWVCRRIRPLVGPTSLPHWKCTGRE